MVPRPGESPGDWWANTGHQFPDPFDPAVVFTHDLPPELAAASLEHVREQSERPFEEPWPLDAWPDVPTRFLLCRDDRFLPAEFQRRVVLNDWGSSPMRWAVVTCQPCPDPRSWSSDWRPTASSCDRLVEQPEDLDGRARGIGPTHAGTARQRCAQVIEP